LAAELDESADWVLAVDLGTATTAAAIRWPSGDVDKVKLDVESQTMPSAVLLAEGQWEAGQVSLDAHALHPNTFVGSPKARLGQEPLVLGEHLVTPEQIAAQVLDVVCVRSMRAAGGTNPKCVVLTHPQGWNRAQVWGLTHAARLAGLAPEQVFVLSEPVAVLHAQGVAPLTPGAPVVVVDVGAGSADVAVVDTVADEPVVIAHGSDDGVGGDRLDDLLYSWTTDRLVTSGHTDLVRQLRQPQNLGTAITVRAAVRAARHALSTEPSAQIGVAPAGGDEITITITVEEFETLVAGLARRIAALVTNTMVAAGTDEPAAVYLTGGATATPAVVAAVRDAAGTDVTCLRDPQFVVATGALRTPDTMLLADPEAGDPTLRIVRAQPRPVRRASLFDHMGVPVAAAAALVVMGVVGTSWYYDANPRGGTQIATAPAMVDPSDGPMHDVSYPKLTGLDGVMRAFPPVPGAAKPTCTETAAGSKGDIERFACTADDDGSVILRFPSAEAAAESLGPESETTTWTVDGVERGTVYTEDGKTTYCYKDVPYCIVTTPETRDKYGVIEESDAAKLAEESSSSPSPTPTPTPMSTRTHRPTSSP